MTETTAAPAPAEAKPNHGLSLADAVAQMKANRVSAPAPTPAKPAPEPAAEASNPEAGETTEANSVDAEQLAPADADEQSTEGAPEAEGEQDDGPTIVQLKDGSQVQLEELVAGYMKDADYRKKTQALSEDRKALVTERQTLDAERRVVADKARELDTTLQSELAAAKAERQKYAVQVEQIAGLLNKQDAEWSRIDWQAERMRDPQAAAAKWMDYQLHRDAMAAAERERADLAAKAKTDAEAADKATQAQVVQAWQQSYSALATHIQAKHADLVDPEKGSQEWRAIAATMKAAGFPDEVTLAALGQRHDPLVPILAPQVFELLRKATLYDRITSERTKALASDTAPKPDASGKIRVVKGTTSRFRPPSPTDSALGRAQAAFNASPSQANAAALMQAKRAAQSAKAR